MMIYVCVWILGFVQSEKCYKDSSNGASRGWFCCNNHVKRNGACVECEIGYVSKDGFPCKPCSLGLWGRRCRDVCSCQHNESCDIVYGCVDATTVISEKWESTETRESTHVLTTPDSFTEADKNVLDVEFLKNEIVIYSICVGSIATIFALASCCLKNKGKVDNLNKSRSPRVQHNQVSSDRTNVKFDNESNAYDTIEEEKLICNERSEHTNEVEIILSTIVDLDVSSSSYNEGVATDPSKEEHSNTCQSMIDVDVHGYRHSAGESTQKSKELSSERSTKSMVDAQKGNNSSRIGFGHKFPSL